MQAMVRHRLVWPDFCAIGFWPARQGMRACLVTAGALSPTASPRAWPWHIAGPPQLPSLAGHGPTRGNAEPHPHPRFARPHPAASEDPGGRRLCYASGIDSYFNLSTAPDKGWPRSRATTGGGGAPEIAFVPLEGSSRAVFGLSGGLGCATDGRIGPSPARPRERALCFPACTKGSGSLLKFFLSL